MSAVPFMRFSLQSTRRPSRLRMLKRQHLSDIIAFNEPINTIKLRLDALCIPQPKRFTQAFIDYTCCFSLDAGVALRLTGLQLSRPIFLHRLPNYPLS